MRIRNEPGIDIVAAAIAAPARARMLGALMGGVALTATELAVEAGVAPSTASGHVDRLARARIVTVVRQGRHRYVRLADPEVATLLESLMAVAARPVHPRRGPRDPALRHARVCYDHLAGATATWMLAELRRRGFIAGCDVAILTDDGAAFFRRSRIDRDVLALSRRPLVRECLDWSERRLHLGGALGAAVLGRVFGLGWARKDLTSRAVIFSRSGEHAFRTWLAA
jgi:DNA-binding transcriptional ArsR family regulator